MTDYFNDHNIDTSHITRCTNGEKLGLTFTEMLSSTESSILMYRNCIADLQLSVDDIDEDYIASGKALLISGTALAQSPSREAALKAVMFAKRRIRLLFLILIIVNTIGKTMMKFLFTIQLLRMKLTSLWGQDKNLI